MKKLLIVLLLLSGCSSITQGTTQLINIQTDPDGASCSVMRNNVKIASINETPGYVQVDKTKYDLIILCSKPGYQNGSSLNKSDVAGMTAGNIILGGVIGWGIDSATGADNKYDSEVFVPLSKK